PHRPRGVPTRLRRALHGRAHGARLPGDLRRGHRRPRTSARVTAARLLSRPRGGHQILPETGPPRAGAPPGARRGREHKILAETAPPGDERTLVLASGDTFAVFDRHGGFQPGPGSPHGLYVDGTRFLSGLGGGRARTLSLA